MNLRLSDLEVRSRSTQNEPVWDVLRLQKCLKAFGITREDIDVVKLPMAISGQEPIGSMGNDAALPMLSKQNKSFFLYFKQLFAQATNPPIDPIREELVTSLVSFIGPKPNLLDINNVNPPRKIAGASASFE